MDCNVAGLQACIVAINVSFAGSVSDSGQSLDEVAAEHPKQA